MDFQYSATLFKMGESKEANPELINSKAKAARFCTGVENRTSLSSPDKVLGLS